MGDPASSLLRKRYRLHELIGRGGTASVYRGRDEALSRDVAIKLYPPTIDARDAKRQEDEVTVLASLDHHGLVTLLDAGMEHLEGGGRRVYLVMQLVTGIDLQQTIATCRPSSRDISHIGYDMAEALQYVHHRGVVHRDIKPSNILMVDYRDDGTRARARLTDFGIAQYGSTSEADDGVTTGTAAYLSPEQVRRTDVGPASDIYSLGLVLLECFTGRLAYPGDAVPSAVARLERAPAIPDDLSEDWRTVLAAMTAQSPADRPTAAQLVGVMRNLVFDETGRHKTSKEFLPPDEKARLEAVRRYDILDTPPEGAFDRITRLAARVLGTPIAIVSIVDAERIWFKSRHGLDIAEIDRDPGLCSSAIMHKTPWVVEDARVDPYVLANPLVASAFGLQFYAGVPLQTRDGYNLGTLCVLDFEPRAISADDLATLQDLAGMVIDELELRLDARRVLDTSTEPAFSD